MQTPENILFNAQIPTLANLAQRQAVHTVSTLFINYISTQAHKQSLTRELAAVLCRLGVKHTHLPGRLVV